MNHHRSHNKRKRSPPSRTAARRTHLQGLWLTVLAVMIRAVTVRSAFQSTSLVVSRCRKRTRPSVSAVVRYMAIDETPTSFDAEPQKTIAKGPGYQAELEVKKSRFIGYTAHAESWKDAYDYIQNIRTQHPKARHCCYGFRGSGSGTGSGSSKDDDVSSLEERCSDDGEPTGTAGVPILGSIRGEGLCDTVCVVVRYFGGIKLGAGGLIRAYGAAARLVLREAPTEIVIPKSKLSVRVGTEHIGALYDVAARFQAEVVGEDYASDGSLRAEIYCDTIVLSQLRDTLNDCTRGNAVFQEG